MDLRIFILYFVLQYNISWLIFCSHSTYLLYGLGQGQIGFLKGVKCALAEMGLIRNVMAAPFEPFSGRERAAVKRALRELRAEADLLATI